jgi:hypothetical protein
VSSKLPITCVKADAPIGTAKRTAAGEEICWQDAMQETNEKGRRVHHDGRGACLGCRNGVVGI